MGFSCEGYEEAVEGIKHHRRLFANATAIMLSLRGATRRSNLDPVIPGMVR
jgi:hypothetical protein